MSCPMPLEQGTSLCADSLLAQFWISWIIDMYMWELMMEHALLEMIKYVAVQKQQRTRVVFVSFAHDFEEYTTYMVDIRL